MLETLTTTPLPAPLATITRSIQRTLSAYFTIHFVSLPRAAPGDRRSFVQPCLRQEDYRPCWLAALRRPRFHHFATKYQWRFVKLRRECWSKLAIRVRTRNSCPRLLSWSLRR